MRRHTGLCYYKKLVLRLIFAAQEEADIVRLFFVLFSRFLAFLME